MESRDFRSPNSDPDGPAKTLWGKEQKEWLKRTLEASDAQYRVLISPTPIVGPDEPGRDYFKWPAGNGDNHINKSYGTEGNEIRRYFGSLKPKNFFEVCGDRHWQYFSVHPETGVHEFSTGPVSDTHTVKPFPADPRYHRFLRFAGGFLSVSLEGSRERPLLTFRFHDTAGKVLHEFTAGK
jgi:alkaline phosphatase D